MTRPQNKDACHWLFLLECKRTEVRIVGHDDTSLRESESQDFFVRTSRREDGQDFEDIETRAAGSLATSKP